MSQFCTMCPKQGVSMAAAYWGRLKGSAAMIMLHVGPAAKGRRVKFTPQVIGKIKEFVAKGISRNEIADRLGVTVGSLQVTCSRLGISLRRSTGSRLHDRCQGKDYFYSVLGRQCARAKAEGSIAAGGPRRAFGQVRHNDATPRQRPNE